MTFEDGTTVLGTGTLSTMNGITTATFTTGNLAVGSIRVIAIYSGDTNDVTSQSTALAFNLRQDKTTTTVATAPATTVFGQSVTFTATVAVSARAPGTPTGTVTFDGRSTVLGTGTLSTKNGVTTATFTTSELAVGPHSITAVYGGDTNDLTSTSAPHASRYRRTRRPRPSRPRRPHGVRPVGDVHGHGGRVSPAPARPRAR